MPKKLKVNGSMMTTRPSSTNTQKGFFLEIPGVTGKFGLGVNNKAGPRLTLLPRKNTLVKANIFIQQHKERNYTWTSTEAQYQNQFDYILGS